MRTIKTQSIGLGAGLVGVAIATSVFQVRFPFFQSPLIADSSPHPSHCMTLVAALKPPLNVRSQPFVAPNNIIGTLDTGMQVSVEKQEGNWLLLNAPIQGWIYQKSTATSCSDSQKVLAAIPPASDSSTPIDSGPGLLAIAAEQYHLGHIDAAIALVQSISAESTAYEEAKSAIVHWPQRWQIAQDQFYSAQHAIREGRWQDVLDRVESYPDIRFWRERLTPVVREAIKQQQRTYQANTVQAQQLINRE
ncbi:SH3 domain-containing protein [Desertifilum sp. FACHB-1129]|uniref:SH3b domain-containing protein n=1 Tax=Desertifilum tharense IPPAS B-1220 TaxID=1781255 RepID=A0A1E5QLY5_9CYAN|nr:MULTISPECIES: SH3 domain-containing protein [Desertifilum]MDA0213391.1 SH3 domain-containing protein [Cyanobacteria bacterium FC1]MBD2313671.1 SH3 domain-containing protein [Desertifilum sp. FACHB-1129]MBD2324815.1 SH3 domain-containing protein [Desertifilum sp. FACHB-866]MBD2334937.1 SH3 domain-containing protein [Desertifilum sp. FACHB-868]OEJ75702.1 hypothetical protein BH720_07950 [Desertifilum tharense IPPAS B-1220]